MQDKIVSFDDENLIVVDKLDNILGYKSKLDCHAGDGVLHRAFSIFIFNDKNELLLHRRSRQKQLWPMYWTNSCCSHPRKGESYDDAAQRRLFEELGIDTRLHYLYKFDYRAVYDKNGSENEVCAVYIGRHNGPANVNQNEIAEWKFVNPEELSEAIQSQPDLYTPWFKMEWERIRNEFWQKVESI